MHSRLSLLAAAFVVSCSAAAAFAAPVKEDGDTWRTAVPYADLKLNTAAGQAVLKARLQQAAEQVCGPRPDQRDLRASADFRSCMKAGVKTALAAIPAASQMAAGEP